MDAHLIDGTYELFRHFCAVAAAQEVKQQEIRTVRAVPRSVLPMIELPQANGPLGQESSCDRSHHRGRRGR